MNRDDVRHGLRVRLVDGVRHHGWKAGAIGVVVGDPLLSEARVDFGTPDGGAKVVRIALTWLEPAPPSVGGEGMEVYREHFRSALALGVASERRREHGVRRPHDAEEALRQEAHAIARYKTALYACGVMEGYEREMPEPSPFDAKLRAPACCDGGTVPPGAERDILPRWSCPRHPGAPVSHEADPASPDLRRFVCGAERPQSLGAVYHGPRAERSG